MQAPTRVAVIFDKLREGTTGVYFERALRALGVSCDHWWLRDADRIPEGYDFYLRVDQGDVYEQPLPARLRPAVFYAIDTHLAHSWPKIRRLARQVDLVFCCHRDGAARLLGAAWLPVACDRELHGAPETEPVWDIGFIGTEGGVPRKFYLQALREAYPNSRIGEADYTEMGSIYSRCRIGFNYAIAGDVNMRVFEVMASGALLVTNALPSGDLERLGFRDREHLVLYRTPRELQGLLAHFLAHPDERLRIARAGQAAVMAGHTYVHRMQALLAAARLVPPPASATPQEFARCVSL